MAHSIKLQLVQWNVNGLKTRLPEVISLITQFQPTALILSETFLQAHEPLTIAQYQCFRLNSLPSTTRASGGLITLVRSDIGARQVPHPAYNRECLCVEIIINNKPLTLISAYDNNGAGDIAQIKSLLLSFRGDVYFMGDMNARNSVWGSTTSNQQGKALHSAFEDADFRLLNDGSPTYQSPHYRTFSHLDLTYCSADLFLCSSWRALISGSSDHSPILICNGTPIDTWAWTHSFWKLRTADWPLFTSSQSPPPLSHGFFYGR